MIKKSQWYKLYVMYPEYALREAYIRLAADGRREDKAERIDALKEAYEDVYSRYLSERTASSEPAQKQRKALWALSKE